jgi:ribosomal protein L11 methyltransferase
VYLKNYFPLVSVSGITEFGWRNMSFELLISFTAADFEERASTKRRVLAWLDACGRSDVVEGVIDGVNMELTGDEEESGEASEDRFSVSPLAVFDSAEAQSKRLWHELHVEFGSDVRMTICEISDDSWQRCWRDEFSAFETNRFYIAPLGDPTSSPPGRIRVEIDDRGGAFGTGQHSTTRAIIKVIEDNFPRWRPASVLDVGTGTGIYLVLAHELGVKILAGTEISEDLVETAMSNCESAKANADIRLADRPAFDGSFDLIIANILVPVLHELMPDMVAHLSKKGRLMVAGFVDKEQQLLVERAVPHGLSVESETSELGWKCVVFVKD